MATTLKHYRCLLYDLVSRDIKTKYRRSVLGILWSVLNPLLMMLVLTAVFANIFRYDINDFPVYYLTGYILFNFVSEATSFSMTSIINASGLIKKVYIPKVIFPLEKCLFSLVNLLFSLIAAVIVFLIVGVTPSWTMLLFPIPILCLFIFNFGFSLILATMNTFFRDVGYLYGVFITLWVYLTPIIYPINVLPAWMQSIVRLNPLTHYVEYFRAVTLYGTLPSLSENLACLAYSFIFLLVGIVVFQKKQNKFIFYI
ncbi:MAG: ABC transporter permease [Ruminococcaceae bacterium]|nr:ABC transporter permease [Oscillospiraceae bacterium]